MRKILVYLFVTIMLFSSIAYASVLVFKENSVILSLYHTSGTPFGATSYPYIDSVYTQRFGRCPDFTIWADDPACPCWISAKAKGEVDPNSRPPTFEAFLQSLTLRITSIKGGDTLYTPMMDLAYDTSGAINAQSTIGTKYFYTWKIDLRNAGIPQDGEAWQVCMQLWDGIPGYSKLISSALSEDRPYIINTARLTPLDSLQWGWNTGLYIRSPDSVKWMLKYFPNSSILLEFALQNEMEGTHCDSIRSYALRYLDNRFHRKDPIFMDRSEFYTDGIDPNPGPVPLPLEDYNYWIEKYLEKCSDTTGFSVYKPAPVDSLPTFDFEKWLIRRLEGE